MLNPDMAIAYSIQSNNSIPISGPRQVCGPKTVGRIPGIQLPAEYGCKSPANPLPPSTWDLCLSYASDNSLFIKSFAIAFTNMTTIGYGIKVLQPNNVFLTTKINEKLGSLFAIDLNNCSL